MSIKIKDIKELIEFHYLELKEHLKDTDIIPNVSYVKSSGVYKTTYQLYHKDDIRPFYESTAMGDTKKELYYSMDKYFYWVLDAISYV